MRLKRLYSYSGFDIYGNRLLDYMPEKMIVKAYMVLNNPPFVAFNPIWGAHINLEKGLENADFNKTATTTK